jgi:hypothetical protein
LPAQRFKTGQKQIPHRKPRHVRLRQDRLNVIDQFLAAIVYYVIRRHKENPLAEEIIDLLDRSQGLQALLWQTPAKTFTASGAFGAVFKIPAHGLLPVADQIVSCPRLFVCSLFSHFTLG